MARVKMTPARQVAAEVVYRVNEEEGYANILLPQVLAEKKLSQRDRGLATELVYGTLRWQKRLDYIIGKFSKRPLAKLDPWVRNLLRLGVYQLFFLDRIPPRAAIFETVQLVKHYGNRGSVAFVNGVLRNIHRDGEKVSFPEAREQPVEHLAMVHSHPRWLVERWLARFGFEETKSLLEANNQPRPLGVRVNTLRITPEELEEQLGKQDIETEPGRYFREALSLKKVPAVGQLEAFQKGYFQVQDEASLAASYALSPRPGDKVLDACAGPGGKTTHLAQLMEDRGRIVAGDLYPHKLQLIEDNCRRLGINSVEVIHRDARLWGQGREMFDRILVDAPCSGTGVLNRRPDSRWRKNPQLLKGLPLLQKEILGAVANRLGPGGILVYSTCSIEEEENISVVESFIKGAGEFRLDDLSPYLPPALTSPTAKDGFVQLYPHRHGVDGFFVARMIRVN